MAFVFHRRLTIQLWSLAFFTVALAASPTATQLLIIAMATLGTAAVVFLVPGAITSLRTLRSPGVRKRPVGR